MIESGRCHRLLEHRFRARRRADLSEVFAAVERGDVVARSAAEHPLVQGTEALRLAESGTVTGKVVVTARQASPPARAPVLIDSGPYPGSSPLSHRKPSCLGVMSPSFCTRTRPSTRIDACTGST